MAPTINENSGNATFVMNYAASEAITFNRFVKVGTDTDQVDACDTSGENAKGVALPDNMKTAYADDDMVPVAVSGVVAVESGAAVTEDGPIMTDASGRCIDHVATNQQLGKALTAAAGAGELVLVALGACPAIA
jgi:hypothetical protein